VLKRFFLIPLVILSVVGLVVTGCAPAEEPTAPAAPAAPAAEEGTWPNRPIEFVIPAGTGGASSVYARMLTAINIKKQYVSQTMLPVNHEGGAGAVGMNYVMSQKGNGYVIMITLNAFVTTPLFQDLPYTFRDFTGISLLALDNFPLWVHVNSPWHTWDEFLATAMEREIEVCGTGTKQEDEIVFRLIEQKTGCKPFHYIPYKGGADVAKALVGEHHEANVNQVSEAGSYYPEYLRPLVVFQPNRLNLPGKLAPLNEVPTGHEVGIDLDYNMMRGIFAAPDISDEARDGLVELFRDIHEDEEWIVFLEEKGLKRVFITGDELTEFLEDYEAMHKELMMNLGWID